MKKNLNNAVISAPHAKLTLLMGHENTQGLSDSAQRAESLL